jgi:hypothetical protein
MIGDMLKLCAEDQYRRYSDSWYHHIRGSPYLIVTCDASCFQCTSHPDFVLTSGLLLFRELH